MVKDMIKQLVLCTDMEGASGLFEENKKGPFSRLRRMADLWAEMYYL